jgi:hypothetical protein
MLEEGGLPGLLRKLVSLFIGVPKFTVFRAVLIEMACCWLLEPGLFFIYIVYLEEYNLILKF